MSRAMNINATVAEMRAACESLGISTTMVEALVPAGTRIVCQNSEDALVLRTKFKAKLITHPVRRELFSSTSSMR